MLLPVLLALGLAPAARVGLRGAEGEGLTELAMEGVPSTREAVSVGVLGAVAVAQGEAVAVPRATEAVVVGVMLCPGVALVLPVWLMVREPARVGEALPPLTVPVASAVPEVELVGLSETVGE